MKLVWHIVIIIALLYWPATKLMAKKYKLEQSRKLLVEIKPKVKTELQKMTEKQEHLKRTYPDISRLPLKADMNWMKIIRGVEKKDRVLKRKIKEIGLGDFDVHERSKLKRLK